LCRGLIPFVGASVATISGGVLARVLADTAGRLLGLRGRTIPAVGHPGDVAVMTTDGAWEWSQAITANAPSWRNEVTPAGLVGMVVFDLMVKEGMRR
jgi:hypothetical protein